MKPISTVTCPRCKGVGMVVRPDAGPLFKRQRTAQKLSLREVARRARITPGYLSRLENGLQPWQGEAAHRIQHILEPS